MKGLLVGECSLFGYVHQDIIRTGDILFFVRKNEPKKRMPKKSSMEGLRTAAVFFGLASDRVVAFSEPLILLIIPPSLLSSLKL